MWALWVPEPAGVEVELPNGEFAIFSGRKRNAAIRDDLLAKRLMLSNQCRVRVRVLSPEAKFVEDAPGAWRTLQAYCNENELRRLYDPVGAGAAVGVDFATLGVASVFIAGGANRQIPLFFSHGSFSILSVVSLGAEILGFVIAGLISGRALGLVIGWPVGALFGLTRKKLL